MKVSAVFKPLAPAWRISVGVFNGIFERNLDMIAAGVAFYALFAIFPALGAVIALWGYLSDPAVVEAQVGLLDGFIPDEAFTLLAGQVADLVAAHDATLGWASLLSTAAAIWSTRAGVGALLRGLNAAYRTSPRGGIWATVWALGMTLLLVVVSLLALGSIVIVPLLLAFIPLGSQTEIVLRVVRWALTIAIMLGMLGLVYRYGPNHPSGRPKWVTPGALVALALWALASAGFTIYLSNFGNYNEVYGSIGAVIALLMWFFISAFSVLLGAAVNSELRVKQETGGQPRGHPSRP